MWKVLKVENFPSTDTTHGSDTVSFSASDVYPIQRLKYIQVLSTVTRSSCILALDLDR